MTQFGLLNPGVNSWKVPARELKLGYSWRNVHERAKHYVHCCVSQSEPGWVHYCIQTATLGNGLNLTQKNNSKITMITHTGHNTTGILSCALDHSQLVLERKVEWHFTSGLEINREKPRAY